MRTDAARGAKLSRRMLELALIKVAERWQLSWINVADYEALGIIEGCSHELAHALDLGTDFEDALRDMGGVEANEHEAAALRIEVAALTILGLRLSMRRLWTTANWDGDIGVPALAQLQAPLNRHERSCARRFVAMVNREVALRHPSSPRAVQGKGIPLVKLTEKQLQCLKCVAKEDPPPFKVTTMESLAQKDLVEHTSLGWRLTAAGRLLLSRRRAATTEVRPAEDRTRTAEVLSRSVDELDLSVRAANCLQLAKIRTLGDLVQRTADDIRRVKWSNNQVVRNIEGALAEFGLSLTGCSTS
jgi:Bacterial RNA polymerase, alpha chain C terminal domain